MPIWDNLNKTTSPGMKPSVQEYYNATLQKNLKPNLVHAMDAKKVLMPLHQGKSVRFRKPKPLPISTVPLSEGVTPEGQKTEMTDFMVMTKDYGQFVEYTDESRLFLLDDEQKIAAQLMSDQANETLDCVLRDAYNAGSHVLYGGDKSSRATLGATDTINSDLLQKLARTFERNSVKRFPDGFYHAIIHPDTKYDLLRDGVIKDITVYQDADPFKKYTIGHVAGFKFYESPNAKVFDAPVNLFGTTANLTIAAVDAANRKLTITEGHTLITPDVARALTGKLVDVKATAESTTQEAVCIERVTPTDGTSAFIYLRWWPQTALAANAVIMPTGGGASGIRVYSTLAYGADSLGMVSLENGGGKVQVIVTPPNDPLRQKGTIGWKTNFFCGVILDDVRVCRIEHGASA